MRGFGRVLIAISLLHLGAAIARSQEKRPAKLEPCDRIELAGRRLHRLAFSRDGKLLAASGVDEIRIIDLGTKKAVRTIKGWRGVRLVTFSPDGKLLAASAAGNHAPPRLWHTQDGSLFHEFSDVRNSRGNIHFSGGGSMFCIFLLPDASVHIWDPKSTERLRKITSIMPETCQGMLSPNGKIAAFVDKNGQVALLEAAKGEELARWQAYDGYFGGLAFSPDSEILATCTYHVKETKQARLWKARSGELIRDLRLPSGMESMSHMEFSSDGRWIGITSRRPETPIFDANNGRHVYDLAGPQEGPSSFAFAPDGVTVAAPSGPTIYFWKLPKEK